MEELQRHLKPVEDIPQEFVFITLSKLATSYALSCIPFLEMTWNVMYTMLGRVQSSRMKQAFCAVLETWSKGVTVYFQDWAKCSFPRIGEAQLCEKTYPFFCYVVRNWLDCEEKELKEDIIRAVAAMMGLLLHQEEYQGHVCDQLSWLLDQYEEVQDGFHVTKRLRHFLEAVEKTEPFIPRERVFIICIVVHNQLSDVTKKHRIGHKTELCHCMLLLARSFPEETMEFLYSQLEAENEASRIAALSLLRFFVHCDREEGCSWFHQGTVQLWCRELFGLGSGGLCFQGVQSGHQQTVQDVTPTIGFPIVLPQVTCAPKAKAKSPTEASSLFLKKQ
ncbi:maestro heat-like repeat-containing protein family member 2B [Dromaius novaehollandiae]|uniref:maestro heat-like repeat-containing protein family member 2B n=1 Tax=Dromaius novaehollandiae TaxID=8790 RepID=UPI00311E88E0